jgi:ankyrin repeat protein
MDIDEGCEKQRRYVDVLQAVRDEDYDMVSILLQYDTDINDTRDAEGNTPLHLAADGGDVEMVALLCEYGANILIRNGYGRCPIHMAAIRGHSETFEYLAAYNSSPLEEDHDGMTCYDYACLYGHLDIVKYLVEEVLIHPTMVFACKGNQEVVIEYLLSRGVKPTVACVYHVVEHNNTRMFARLLQDIDDIFLTYAGMSIEDMVVQHNAVDMMPFLQEKMKESGLFDSFNKIYI